jgi:hypothetical protein
MCPTMTKPRLDFGTFEISRENLPGSVEHHLARGQDAVADQRTNHVTGDSERGRGFQHRETLAILHRRLVPGNAGLAPIVCDPAAIPRVPLTGRQAETVQRDGDIGVRPAGGHLADQLPRIRGRSLRVLAGGSGSVSKKIDNHKAAIALHFMHYNFARIHTSLRVTPAMEAGISNHVWEVSEIVGLLDWADAQPERSN